MNYLSYFLSDNTPVYGGRKKAFEVISMNTIANGSTANDSLFQFPNHIGTHIDFPKHFNDSGAVCEDYPAGFWIFNSVGFLECSVEEIPDLLHVLPENMELLILKTGYGAKRGETEYWSSQPVIPAALAGKLKSLFPHLRVFGFDLISLTSKLDRPEGKQAHLQFLIENEILILEDMDLSTLSSTPERVVIAPLQVKGANGVPCTVIAFGDA